MKLNHRKAQALRHLGWSLAGLILGCGVGAGYGIYQVAQQTRFSQTVWPLMKAAMLVENNYVEAQTTEKTKQRLLTGFIDSLDPHSNYLPPKDLEAMNQEMQAAYGGIGISAKFEQGRIVVTDLHPEGPASKAGLRQGDSILTIDGASIAEKKLNITQAFALIRGPVGESVKLGIASEPGSKAPREVKVMREQIRIPTVQWSLLDAPGKSGKILYLKVRGFNEQLLKEMGEHAKTIAARKQNITGIVLDLRNNPGGLVSSAVGLAAFFLPPETIVVTAKERAGRNEQVWRVRPEDWMTGPPQTGNPVLEGLAAIPEFQTAPLHVLTNRSSASASELVAGALQDWKRGVVYGGITFGKGSVQSLYPLGGGDGAVKLTTSRYYTPKGRAIQANGVDPDVPVADPSDKGRREADLQGHLPGERGLERKGTPAQVPASAPASAPGNQGAPAGPGQEDEPAETLPTFVYELPMAKALAKTDVVLQKSLEKF